MCYRVYRFDFDVVIDGHRLRRERVTETLERYYTTFNDSLDPQPTGMDERCDGFYVWYDYDWDAMKYEIWQVHHRTANTAQAGK